MPNLDLKKLITGFLIFAAITSSSVFLFSGFLSSGNTKEVGNGQQGQNARLLDSVRSNVPDNVFVEPIPKSNPIGGANIANSQDDGLPPISASANLTDRLAATIVRNVVKQNPQGPDQNQNDQLSINSPDLDATIEEALAGKSAKDSLANGWNIHIADAEIKIIRNPSANDIQSYSDSLGQIMTGGIGDPKVQNILLSGDNSPNTINAVAVAVDETDVALRKLSVPATLVNFHKNFLTLVAYEKRAVSAPASDDPLSEMLALQNEERNISLIFDNFEKETKKAALLLGKSSVKENTFSALAGLFEIKTAHAQWTVFDPAALARTVWTWIKTHLEKIILQTLKNRLVHHIMQQTINWVQGGGKPQFITNWRRFLGQTEKDAVSIAIQDKIPGLCQSLGPLIKLQLNRTYLSNPLELCTLDQVVQNVRNFYGDFSQGGWVGYGALILPSGNYFGSLFETTQKIEAERLAKKEAAKSSAEASGGFLATTMCVKHGTSPAEDCMQEESAKDMEDRGQADYGRCRNLSAVKSCLEYKDTTPGRIAGDAVAETIGAPLKNIVSAQDIAGLASAVVNSALNRLILAGARGLTGVLMRDRISGNEPPPPGDVAPPNPSEIPPEEIGPIYHTECQDNACVAVTGPGTDQCQSETQCQTSPEP